MVDRKASQVYVVDDVPADGDAVTWDASLRQWAPRAGGLSSDYEAALGKYTSDGYQHHPTLYNPTSAIWSDDWWESQFKSTDTFTSIRAFGDVVFGSVFERFGLNDTNGVDTGRSGGTTLQSFSDDGNKYAIVSTSVNCMPDGTQQTARVLVDTNLLGYVDLFAGASQAYVNINASAGQTEGMLEVYDEDGVDVLYVGQSSGGGGKIGFFNATPVTQRTGVAVSAAGIHAALVSLGLVTA